MSELDKLRGSASRKLNRFDQRKLQRALAAAEQSRAEIARSFGVSTSYVSQFAKTYAADIDAFKRDLDNRFAGLWIADKEARIQAYQADFQMALDSDKADHHEWIKARSAILHDVAEELGDLPPRATIAVVPVTHVIVGVDPDALT